MQNGFLSPDSPLFIAGAPETVPICANVINFCRNKGIPVFFVTREYSADGSNVEHTRYDVWLKGGKPLSPSCEKSISSAMPVFTIEIFCLSSPVTPPFSAPGSI